MIKGTIIDNINESVYSNVDIDVIAVSKNMIIGQYKTDRDSSYQGGKILVFKDHSSDHWNTKMTYNTKNASELFSFAVTIRLSHRNVYEFAKLLEEMQWKLPNKTAQNLMSYFIAQQINDEMVNKEKKVYEEYAVYSEGEKEARREEYKKEWPAYCKECNGHGIVFDVGDRDREASVSACIDCTEKGFCPRCMAQGLSNEEKGDLDTGSGPCEVCEWNYDEGSPLPQKY